MNIKVSYIGVIDIKKVQSGSTVNIKEGSTVSELLNFLDVREQHKKYLVCLVNDKKKRLNYVLKENDHLSLFLPVGGG
ncbi:MAG: MoaD/ThiS family protein [Victivallales bacterium]|nr:MoaD/ThiS family protein [Victivallales bacterium]MCF7889532.1 MoaD/ThiS family protein [Victivallales bacterium]